MNRSDFEKKFLQFYENFKEIIPQLQSSEYLTLNPTSISFSCDLTTLLETNKIDEFKYFCKYVHPILQDICEIKNNVLTLTEIPYWKYKLSLFPDWKPLEDEQFKSYIPESYKMLDDLQPKQFTKQGSNIYIQKTFMQRMKNNLDSQELLLVFDNKSKYLTRVYDEFNNSNSEILPTFSLNIHYNRSYINKKFYSEEYMMSAETYTKFKDFMSVPITKTTIEKSNHQGCYLIQLNCDKDTDKYKIGKSENLLTRLKSTEYRNAFIYTVMFVQDETACEKEIIKEFTSKYKLIDKDVSGNFGKETFRGDIREMMQDFQDICWKYV